MINNVTIGSVTLEQAAIHGHHRALNYSFQGKLNGPDCFLSYLPGQALQ